MAVSRASLENATYSLEPRFVSDARLKIDLLFLVQSDQSTDEANPYSAPDTNTKVTFVTGIVTGATNQSYGNDFLRK